MPVSEIERLRRVQMAEHYNGGPEPASALPQAEPVNDEWQDILDQAAGEFQLHLDRWVGRLDAGAFAELSADLLAATIAALQASVPTVAYLAEEFSAWQLTAAAEALATQCSPLFDAEGARRTRTVMSSSFRTAASAWIAAAYGRRNPPLPETVVEIALETPQELQALGIGPEQSLKMLGVAVPAGHDPSVVWREILDGKRDFPKSRTVRSRPAGWPRQQPISPVLESVLHRAGLTMAR